MNHELIKETKYVLHLSSFGYKNEVFSSFEKAKEKLLYLADRNPEVVSGCYISEEVIWSLKPKAHSYNYKVQYRSIYDNSWKTFCSNVVKELAIEEFKKFAEKKDNKLTHQFRVEIEITYSDKSVKREYENLFI